MRFTDKVMLYARIAERFEGANSWQKKLVGCDIRREIEVGIIEVPAEDMVEVLEAIDRLEAEALEA